MDKQVDDIVKVYITDGGSSLTLDDLAPRFPPHTTLILSNGWGQEGEVWCLECTPDPEYFEGSNPVWPWPTGIAEYGPTSQSVIDAVDELLRKVKR